MTIRLVCDPATGKRDILVKLDSDQDALPWEHEQQHRALVEKLVQGGLVSAAELGQVIVERDNAVALPDAQPVPQDEAATRQAQEQGVR